MKTIFTALIITFTASSALAGSINRYSSFSAEYTRTLNRAATTDIDASFYNPAGLVFGKEGGYFGLANQFSYILGEFKQEEFSASNNQMSYACPTMMGTYRSGNWAYYLSGGVLYGGVTEFGDNHPVFRENKSYVLSEIGKKGLEVADVEFSESKLNGLNFILGGTAGISYKVDGWLGLSLGVKYAYSWGKLDIGSDFELLNKDGSLLADSSDVPALAAQMGFEGMDPNSDGRMVIQGQQTGHGVGLVVGVHVRPAKNLDIAIRAESSTKIINTISLDKDSYGIFTDGDESRNDIPGYLTSGIAYRPIPKLQLAASWGYYFNKFANLGAILGFDITGMVDDGWEAGFGLDYEVTNNLTIGAGYLRLIAGYNDKSRSIVRFILDSHHLSIGGTYQLTKKMNVTFGFMPMIYDSARDHQDITEISGLIYNFGLGFSYGI
ncbi:MAG: outer membrane protein transport protein [Myxococcota bacterium]|nr:outer membrane protein transport protein [Myxococcota bacterium]